MEKKNTLLYVIITILCVLVLLLGGYIVYDKLEKNDNELSDKKQDENTNVTKLDDTRDWIYDAEYEKNVTANSYTTVYNNTYYADDIKVPYINVNSEYAKKANEEIKATFDEAIRTYNNEVNDYAFTLDECDYYKYIGKNLASTITVYSYHLTDVPKPNYKTYNISLKTGKEMTYEEVYKELGYNKDNIEQFAEKAIISKLKEYINKLDFVTDNEYKNYKNESINNYKKSLKDKTLQYFVNEDGKLSIIVKLIFPVGVGEFNKIVTIN